MDHDNDILGTYEIILLSFVLVYISIFFLSNIPAFETLIMLELFYGYGFVVLLSMFIAWGVLLKIFGIKNLTNIGIAILLLGFFPVIGRVVMLVGGYLGILVGWTVLSLLFLYSFIAGIILMFYYVLKGPKSKKKFKLHKI